MLTNIIFERSRHAPKKLFKVNVRQTAKSRAETKGAVKHGRFDSHVSIIFPFCFVFIFWSTGLHRLVMLMFSMSFDWSLNVAIFICWRAIKLLARYHQFYFPQFSYHISSILLSFHLFGPVLIPCCFFLVPCASFCQNERCLVSSGGGSQAYKWSGKQNFILDINRSIHYFYNCNCIPVTSHVCSWTLYMINIEVTMFKYLK